MQKQTLERAKQLLGAVAELQPVASYLAQAGEVLPPTEPWQDRASAMRDQTLETIRHFGKGDATREAITAIAPELAKLKADYIQQYSQMHQMAVLGPNDDDRRKKLMDDQRVQAMKELAKLDLLSKSRTELEGWALVLSRIPTCLGFHASSLESSPKCRSCNYSPRHQAPTANASATLSSLDAKLDTLLESWQQAVRDGLSSETAQESLANMTASERKPVDDYLAQPATDASVPHGLVLSAGSALKGILSFAIDGDQLLDSLRAGGMPCTVDQLRQRFTNFVNEEMRNHDSKTTRVSIPASAVSVEVIA